MLTEVKSSKSSCLNILLVLQANVSWLLQRLRLMMAAAAALDAPCDDAFRRASGLRRCPRAADRAHGRGPEAVHVGSTHLQAAAGGGVCGCHGDRTKDVRYLVVG